MSLSRYPRTPAPSSGLSWTGDNTGAITPAITGGQAVEVRFDDFTGDNLYIGDGQWPYLALAQINGSTTLTNIRVPAMLGVKKFYLTACTQANMTVTGAALSWLIFDTCGCSNVTLSCAINGKLYFTGASSTAPLVCTIPSGVTELLISDCNFASVPAFPTGLTDLRVTGCPNVTTLPELPSGLLNLGLTGSVIASLPTLPEGLTTLGLNGCGSLTELPTLPSTLTSLDASESGISDLTVSPLPVGLLTLIVSGCNIDEGSIGDVSLLTSLTRLDFSNNNFGSYPSPTPSDTITILNFSGNSGLSGSIAGNPMPANCTSLSASNCSLTEADVDSILSALVANGKLNGGADVGGTNSAPSAAGLVSKATLEGRGWTVIVTE